jgi:hypothetical protein
MFKRKLLIGALASVAACSSFAEDSDLSYTYVGVAYQTGEIVDEDFAGFGIGGSAAINDSIFVLGQYSSLISDDEFDVGFGAGDIEVTQFNFGIGFHTPMANNVDFVASLSYVDAEIEYLGVTVDGNGYLLSLGVRGKPTDVLELSAAINYADIEDEGEAGYGVSARFFAAPKISIGLGYGSADDVDTISLDLRFDI